MTLPHPAIAVARERTAHLAGDFTTVAVRAHDDVAAVLMDSDLDRLIIVVENRDGAWTAPEMIVGSPRPSGPRETTTAEYRPLKRMSRKRTATLDDDGNWPEYLWFAVSGLAAEDADAVSITADGHETREYILADGLAFALARVHRDSEPEVYVHTRDGRKIAAWH